MDRDSRLVNAAYDLLAEVKSARSDIDRIENLKAAYADAIYLAEELKKELEGVRNGT